MTRSEAFAEVYDEHVWDVYGFFGYRVRSREQAEDLTQSTFERAFHAWHRYDPARASARTWLLAIARNLLIDYYRSDRSSLQQPIEEGADEPVGWTAEPELGIEPALATALSTLSGRERELIALRFGGDLTGPEIAELTGLSLANVQQILSRSLRRLRTELEGQPTRARLRGERSDSSKSSGSDGEQQQTGYGVAGDQPA
jgi:RNA polymerase sigma-70 factor (ECF subfamily)